MNMKTNSAVKYIGSALAVGGTVMLGASMLNPGNSFKKKAKKTAGKAIDALDDALNGIQNFMK